MKGDDAGAYAVDPGVPFAGLPDPLRSVCAKLNSSSAGWKTCTAIASRLTTPAPTPLQGVNITLEVLQQFDPANPPSRTDPTLPEPIYEDIDLT